jgi:tetratricopeptide (TPR) repeat protein
MGRAFWTGPMYELVGELMPDLTTLESRDFIRRRASSTLEGEIEYVFKHALTREVAYNSLTKARRARLHSDFAQWIERTGGDRDEYAPLLAHHYAEAVRPENVDVAWPDGGDELASLRENALHWLQRAADAAISRYEIDDALALLHRAVALESDANELPRLWRRIGRAHALKYDGEAFMDAMQRALTICDDPRECAEAYADLAFEGALRSGMWRRRPASEEMSDWTSRALAGVEPGTASHVKALISRAFWGLGNADETELAARLATELGEIGLLSAALDARGVTSFREGDFEQAYAWESKRFELLPQMSDPDLIHDLYLSTIPTAAASGRLDEARRLARDLRVVVSELTTHHRVHGTSCVLEVEELMGDWNAARTLSAEVQDVVEQNRDTPCVRNARSLLVCAVAHELAGETDVSRELERRAEELRNEGYGSVLVTPRARLALTRGELDLIEEVLADEHWLTRQTWFALPSAAMRLDALAVIGREDEVEEAARALAPAGSYVEPFALRALGVVREDEELLRKADALFAVLGLRWHSEQTAMLIDLRTTAA